MKRKSGRPAGQSVDNGMPPADTEYTQYVTIATEPSTGRTVQALYGYKRSKHGTWGYHLTIDGIHWGRHRPVKNITILHAIRVWSIFISREHLLLIQENKPI